MYRNATDGIVETVSIDQMCLTKISNNALCFSVFLYLVAMDVPLPNARRRWRSVQMNLGLDFKRKSFRIIIIVWRHVTIVSVVIG